MELLLVVLILLGLFIVNIPMFIFPLLCNRFELEKANRYSFIIIGIGVLVFLIGVISFLIGVIS